MFYVTEIKDHIRVPPELFNLLKVDAITKRIKKDYEGVISKDFGIVIDVGKVKDVKEGIIIPGDGAAYYESVFELFVYKPEMQEVIVGNIKDIADFGAFITLGPIEGMIHVSQTMDDFVSFAKDKTLSGKETKRVLKIGDKCKARVIAISFKDITNPKLGLTMRQVGLGKAEWSVEAASKSSDASKTEEEAKPKKK